MIRAPVADEIAAVRSVCRTLGLQDVRPVVLKAAHHTTLLLPPLELVARVQTCEPLDTARRRAVREVAVARHLAAQGAPVLAPLETLAGPHISGRAVVTLWPYLEHERTADETDAWLAAQTLALVHEALRDYRSELPPYTRALDRCWNILKNVNSSPALCDDDRDLLRKTYCRLRQEVESSASRWVPLHGDAHLGNLLISDRGPVWTDFEDACLGPVEQDIACLPRVAWAQFTNADQGLVKRCSDLKSVCVAVWCSADVSRSAEVREAAEHHLHRVRRLGL